jgi:hypothetical protein
MNMNHPLSRTAFFFTASFLVVASSSRGEDSAGSSADDLAKKLANPISSLISLPIQSNFDFGFGPGEGTVWRTNVQPVIPISLNEDWNLISRTILPLIEQEGLAAAGDSLDAAGLGDTSQSLFFSPVDPTAGGWIWGAGPVFLLPTASEMLLGGEKWGAGPTAVVLKQEGAWTYGALANQIWDVAGDDARSSINATFLQPFVSYITPTKTTFTVNSESTYDWVGEQWTVPLNFQVAQLLKLGEQPAQIFAGVRYFAEAPANGPEWGLRFGVTLLWPK